MNKITPQWTLGIAVVAGGLNLIAGLGLKGLTPLEAGAVITLINALALAVAALKTRPIAPQVFTYVVTSAAAVAAAWGFHVQQGTVSGVSTFLLAVLALLTHGQVSPASKDAAAGRALR
jgi:uncharacterized membrane protein